MNKILVSGSLAYDYVMNFPDSFKNHIMPDQLHILNVCFMIDKLNKGWGGTAGNLAYSLNLLGSKPEIFSAVGKDGKEYIDHFKENEISVENIIKDNGQFTSSAYITTDADDNQITAFYNGPLELGLDQNIYEIENPRDYKLAIIGATQKEVMIKHLKESKELGLETVFAPGQQITALKEIDLKKMLDQSDFLIGNDYEIKLLQEKIGWDMKKILENTKAVITTLGGSGSIVTTTDGEIIEVGVCSPLSVDDPTGAGDAYCAGFFAGYVQGFDFKICAQMGATASVYAIENYGTQAHKYTKQEYLNRYEENFGEKINLNF